MKNTIKNSDKKTVKCFKKKKITLFAHSQFCFNKFVISPSSHHQMNIATYNTWRVKKVYTFYWNVFFL